MKLTKDPIPQLIAKISIPAGIGMFFQTMYNLVDTYWAGTLSVAALGGLSFTFPLFLLVISLGIGIGQGTNALISHALGEDKLKKAKKYQVQAIMMAIIVSIFVSIIGIAFTKPLLEVMGASGEEFLKAQEYIRVIFLGAITMILAGVTNAGLLAQGDSKSNRNALIGGFFANLILDPLLLYGYGPIPAMGIDGIALATVIIQACVFFYLFLKLKHTPLMEKTTLKSYKPHFSTWKEIAYQGLPASLNMMLVSLGVFVINGYISRYNDLAVSAYGVAIRIEQMVLLPAMSLNVAALSLTGQNFGARQFVRVKEIYASCLRYGLIIMTIGAAIVLTVGKSLMGIFTQDPEVISVGIQYLKIDAFVFPAYMLLFLSIAVLQGLKKPLYGMYIGIYRQVAGPLIIFWLLAEWLDLELLGIWLGIFITTWSAALITVIAVRKNIHQMES